MNSSIANDFAMKIIDKELELESNCCLASLEAVANLYKEAIEYYEEVNSPSLWDFQERLQQIFMRPDVLKMLQSNKTDCFAPVQRQRPRIKTSPPAVFTSSIHRSNTLPELHSQNSITQSTLDHSKSAHRILTTQHQRTSNVSSRALTDLKSQEHSLTERHKSRQQKFQNLSSASLLTSFCSKNQSFSSPQSPYSSSKGNSFYSCESDVSTGVNAYTKCSERIEMILEENFNEKAERITEIKVKFGTQIAEMEEEGGIYLDIVKEMKNQMEKEIRETHIVMDERRKSQIMNVRAELENC